MRGETYSYSIRNAPQFKLSKPSSWRLLRPYPPQSFNNCNTSFICRQTHPRNHSFLLTIHSTRSLQATHLYNDPLQPVCQISRMVRMLWSLLNCNSVISNVYGSEGGACVATTSLRHHTPLQALLCMSHRLTPYRFSPVRLYPCTQTKGTHLRWAPYDRDAFLVLSRCPYLSADLGLELK